MNEVSFLKQDGPKEVERQGGCEGRRGRGLELEHPIQPLPSDRRLQEWLEAWNAGCKRLYIVCTYGYGVAYLPVCRYLRICWLC